MNGAYTPKFGLKKCGKVRKLNKSNQVFLKKKKKTKGTNTISIDTAEFKEKWSTKLWAKKENEDKKQFVIKRYKSNKLAVLKLPGERTLR